MQESRSYVRLTCHMREAPCGSQTDPSTGFKSTLLVPDCPYQESETYQKGRISRQFLIPARSKPGAFFKRPCFPVHITLTLTFLPSFFYTSFACFDSLEWFCSNPGERWCFFLTSWVLFIACRHRANCFIHCIATQVSFSIL